MDCNILIWNVRGLNDLARRDVVRLLLSQHNVSVVCLQESKLAVVDVSVIMQICGSMFDGFEFVPAAGTRGGIIVAWRTDRVALSNFQSADTFLAAEAKLTNSDVMFNLVTVYGPQATDDKLNFLADLKNLYLNLMPTDRPCILAGDFNLIAAAADKNNSRINRRCLTAFRGFINDLQLRDLYLQGRRYTWSNEQRQATMVRLDRVLFNEEWDAQFPGCLLQALSSEMSDHCPLLLSCDAGFQHHRRFRFENHWVKLDGYKEVVAHTWNSVPNRRDSLSTIAVKLRATARALRRWSSRFHSDLALRAAITSTLIMLLDRAMDNRVLTDAELQFRAMLKMNRLGIAAVQRSMWRQRSRIQWIKEGEANTRYFHAKASARRRKNHIHRLVVNGTVITEQKAKEQALFDHFNSMMGSARERPRTLNLAAIDVQAHNLADLDAPFSVDEIRAAVFELDTDKAPGPDGFTALFVQSCWPIICDDFIAGIKALQDLNSINLHMLNSATLVLLPKSPDAEAPKQFRPISLIGIFAKIVMKLLALRLRPKMQEIVRPCQNAFIAGRTIHDSFVYVRGMARAFRQEKTPALMIKLDVEKAFDSVSWEFLLQLLEKLGFSRRWRDRLSLLLSTASTRVLVNGALTEPIDHGRGLRQGDPLSPLLFDFVMDCLAGLFSAAVDAGMLALIGNRHMPFRTALYADDAVLFINPLVQEVMVVKQLLDLFGDATGLRTNYEKSSITPICCDGIDLSAVLTCFGCQTKTFPCTYLGMPLSDSRLTRGDLQPIYDRICSKFQGWQHLHLNLGDRLILVRHVLSAMPIFQMLVLDLPVWLRKLIVKLLRSFLWENKEVASGGKCLVNWKAVCRPGVFGGLGITDLQAQGIALRSRWLWQSWTDPAKPWQGLPLPIDAKTQSLFNSCVRFTLGDGARLKFWHDPWFEGGSFVARFPDLFKVCTRRQLTVKEALINSRWTKHLRAFLPTQAIVQFVVLWELMDRVVLNTDESDTASWRLTHDGRFTVASAYAIQFEGAIRADFTTIVWKTEAPLRCKVFSWLAVLGKCLTADNLIKRNWPCNPICPLCRIKQEDAVHLLANCSFVKAVWMLVLNYCRLPATLCPPVSDVASLTTWWTAATETVPQQHRHAWSSVVQLVWWTVWKERNARIFRQHASSHHEVFYRFKDDLSAWVLAGRKKTATLIGRPREPD